MRIKMRNQNDKAQMTNECQSPNDKFELWILAFDILIEPLNPVTLEPLNPVFLP